MSQTCKQAVYDVFAEDPGPLSAREVIDRVNKKYPSKPWKSNTIRAHLIGLSVNHTSGKHQPELQKSAFLFYLGNGQYRRLGEKDKIRGYEQIGQKEPGSRQTISFSEDALDGDDEPIIVNKKTALNERQWMTQVLDRINEELQNRGLSNLLASQGAKLPYAFEILSYDANKPIQINNISYETDLLVYEVLDGAEWKPRIVIEGKLGRVTTHDAITYSQKALTHKNVHPFLRYGILLGDRKQYPLPGRLFRHGAYFDFMLSFKSTEPTSEELNDLIQLILEEVEASRNLDEILYNSRNPNRKRFTLLHKPLKLK